jgi:hypothetical protein
MANLGDLANLALKKVSVRDIVKTIVEPKPLMEGVATAGKVVKNLATVKQLQDKAKTGISGEDVKTYTKLTKAPQTFDERISAGLMATARKVNELKYENVKPPEVTTPSKMPDVGKLTSNGLKLLAEVSQAKLEQVKYRNGLLDEFKNSPLYNPYAGGGGLINKVLADPNELSRQFDRLSDSQKKVIEDSYSTKVQQQQKEYEEGQKVAFEEMKLQSAYNPFALKDKRAGDVVRGVKITPEKEKEIIMWEELGDVVEEVLKSGASGATMGVTDVLGSKAAPKLARRGVSVENQEFQNQLKGTLDVVKPVLTTLAGFAGGAGTYGAISNIVGKGLSKLPIIGKFAEAHPTFTAYTLQNLGEEGVEMAVRRSTGQEYGFNDFMRGMAMGTAFLTGFKVWGKSFGGEPNTVYQEMASKSEEAIKQAEVNKGAKLTGDEVTATLLPIRLTGGYTIGDVFNQARLAYKTGGYQPMGSGKMTSLKDMSGRASVTDLGVTIPAKPFEDSGDLSTKIINKLEGKTTVSRQFIEDLTNGGDVKQVEKDLIRGLLQGEGDKVNVEKFANKVKGELLPLKRTDLGEASDVMNGEQYIRYESISLPDELKGNVANYTEILYESPVKTQAGKVHFSDTGTSNYFGHTRVEDMAPDSYVKGEYAPAPGTKGTTRRIIEVQSDLYQKGRLEGEGKVQNYQLTRLQFEERMTPDELAKYKAAYNIISGSGRFAQPEAVDFVKRIEEKYRAEIERERFKQVSKLQQYNDPTAHFRMVREELKRAAADGKQTVLFPTGETAMKIEGLGQQSHFYVAPELSRENLLNMPLSQVNRHYRNYPLTPEKLKTGLLVQGGGQDWIITDILGDGKFKAVPKKTMIAGHHAEAEFYNKYKQYASNVNGGIALEDLPKEALKDFSILPQNETFDISGKVDANNPIYKFYEKELGRYLKNNYEASPITDAQGVSWYAVNLNAPKVRESVSKPVFAFKTGGNEELTPGKISEAAARKAEMADKLNPLYAEAKKYKSAEEFVKEINKKDWGEAVTQPSDLRFGKLNESDVVEQSVKLPFGVNGFVAKDGDLFVVIEKATGQVIGKGSRLTRGDEAGIKQAINDATNALKNEGEQVVMQDIARARKAPTDGYYRYWNKISDEKLTDIWNKAQDSKTDLSQKDIVAKAVSDDAKTIKQIAEETRIKEPNIRRILGVGAKEGTFERLDKGVYVLNKNGKQHAYIETGDATAVLPRMASEGMKADMVFLDIPYKTTAVSGGNRGAKFDFISTDEFATVANAVKQIARNDDTPVFYMFSQAPSGMKQMQKYTDKMIDAGFKPVARGEYTKLQQDGVTRTRNMRGQPDYPEGIIMFTKSGTANIENPDLNFKLVRPKGYQTEKPAELARRLIHMATKEGEVVLDPFSGSGVVPAEAIRAGRKAVAVEKSANAVENYIKPRVEEAYLHPEELSDKARAQYEKEILEEVKADVEEAKASKGEGESPVVSANKIVNELITAFNEKGAKFYLTGKKTYKGNALGKDVTIKGAQKFKDTFNKLFLEGDIDTFHRNIEVLKSKYEGTAFGQRLKNISEQFKTGLLDNPDLYGETIRPKLEAYLDGGRKVNAATGTVRKSVGEGRQAGDTNAVQNVPSGGVKNEIKQNLLAREKALTDKLGLPTKAGMEEIADSGFSAKPKELELTGTPKPPPKPYAIMGQSGVRRGGLSNYQQNIKSSQPDKLLLTQPEALKTTPADLQGTPSTKLQGSDRDLPSKPSEKELLDKHKLIFGEDIITPGNGRKPPIVRGGIQAPEFDASTWKDKQVLTLGRETMDRNLDAVAGKDAGKIRAFLTDKVRANENDRTDFVNNFRRKLKEKAKEYGIKAGSKEDALIQKYGEENISLDDLKRAAPEKWQDIVKAAEYFKGQYSDLINTWNAVRKKFGYAPIPKRTDYFRHFYEATSVIDKFGMMFKENDLPTEISGLTAIFKPGKPFSTAELKRVGGKYTESAFKGMDNYIESVSKPIYHTDSVQRARALESYIREQASPELIKTNGVALDDKQTSMFGGETVKEATEAKPKVNLAHFVANVNEYGNILAGKKASLDRAFEGTVGRGVYGAATALKNRVGANMVGANISSALTNYIPFTQSLATTSKTASIRGLYDTMSIPVIKKVDFFDIDGTPSNFLKRRFPEGKIAPDFWQGVGDKASWIFQKVDGFTSRSIVAGKYFEGLEDGLSKSDAMARADKYAADVIADRSFGQLPNLFSTKSLGFVTQFQLEVNNMYSFLKKDIPKMYGGNTKKVASALAQFAIYSYIFNNAYEQVVGRRPTIDPIYAGLTIAGLTPESEGRSPLERVAIAGEDIAGNLPFVGGITGGRLPIGAALPDFGALGTGILELSQGKNTQAINDIYKGAAGSAAYLIPPLGGGQIKKTAEGLNAYFQGKTTTKSGNTKFDVEQNPQNLLRQALFGKYATPDAREYYAKLGVPTAQASTGGTSGRRFKITKSSITSTKRFKITKRR